MTNRTNHHPSDSILKSFTEGQLGVGVSVAVSAHLELCQTCREKSATLKAKLASEWVSEQPAVMTEKFGNAQAMLDKITRQPQITVARRFEDTAKEPVELHMHERSVTLPHVLEKAARKGVIWRKLAGGINTANLVLDRDSRCDFMYMKPGSQAPRHTHGGIEITLVLEGTFEDELGEYGPGDFVLRHEEHTHKPRSDEGCLCYSVLDRPLLFTAGWSRMLNPFQRFLFNRQPGRNS